MKRRMPSSSRVPQFGANPPHRAAITADERFGEVARLLALGYLRLLARRQRERANGPNHLSSFGLDFRAERSVCDTDTPAQRKRR